MTYHPIYDEYEKEQYEDQCPVAIKWVKVQWEQENGLWLVDPMQIKGHESHYSYPHTGQWLPYNVIFRKGVEAPHPRSMFNDTGNRRTTLV